MKTKIFDWSTEQADRFQALLNNCDSDLDDFQLDEALQDFIDFEEDESQ
ncbi:MAG: hypothetical protein H8D45_28505, partial [Bacteroidetes bacterium]|nr:hypothetical protein [Bacteroidota bacterium]